MLSGPPLRRVFYPWATAEPERVTRDEGAFLSDVTSSQQWDASGTGSFRLAS